MAHMDETNFVLALAQRFHDSVYAVAGKAKDNLNTPIDERIDQNICTCTGHLLSLYSAPRDVGALNNVLVS